MPGHNPYGAQSASPPIDGSREDRPEAGALGAPVSSSPSHDRRGERRNGATPISGDPLDAPVDEPADLESVLAAVLDLEPQGIALERAYLKAADEGQWPADPAGLDWGGVLGVSAGDEVLTADHVTSIFTEADDGYVAPPEDADLEAGPIYRVVVARGEERHVVLYARTLPIAGSVWIDPPALTGDASAVDPQAGDDPGDNVTPLVVPLDEVPDKAADVVAWLHEHPLGSVLRHARATAAAEAETARPGDPRSTVDAAIVETLAHPVEVEDATGDNAGEPIAD